MKYLILSLGILLSGALFAQHSVSGTVVDAATQSPLTFASIKADDGTTTGSDLNGKFTLESVSEIKYIQVSYIGYKTKKVAVPRDAKVPLKVSLEEAENALDEVTVNYVNPAHAIIRKVIANKKKNNPNSLESFVYNCYNKVMLNVRHTDSTHTGTDMTKHAFMMESVTKRKFLKPDLSEETVLATRVSGFQNPAFAAVMTDFQPFSFYEDDIKLLDRHYLNPIANGSLAKYRFRLEETRASEKDTVFIISFAPKKDKNFDALKGLLYINSNGYAVQNVVAAPAEKKKVELRIRQQYQYTGGQWFPEKMNFALVFNEYPAKKMYMIMDGKSYIDSVQINPALRRKDFGLETVRLSDDSAKKDEAFWDAFRREQINSVDLKTYRLLDSVGKEHNLDRMLAGIVRFANGRLPIGPVDIDLNRTFTYNKYEGLRMGTGFYTNEKLFKKLTIGGFYGYGNKDEESKYGGELTYTLSKNHEFRIGAQYYHDLAETGIFNADLSRKSVFGYRKYIASRFDMKDGENFWVEFRSFRWFKWRFSMATEAVTPKYLYAFYPTPLVAVTDYHNTSLNVNLRFAYKERLTTVFGQRTSSGTDYPVLNVSYSRGFRDVLNGDLSYNRIEAQIDQSFYTKNFGTTSYTLQGCYVDSPLPYGLLFTGEGSYDKEIPIIMKNAFQTMRPYEFLSDRYVNVFLSHHFSGLLFKAGKFQPGISLHTNMGWGDLSHPDFHESISFKTKNRWFLESGLQLDNLLKLDYFGIANAGFGLGAYYRYGAYSLPDFEDNVALKATFTFTLK